MKKNLFSIGAMRAGSTSLYNYLAQHPDIFIPHVKEPDFFIAEEARESLKSGVDSEEQHQRLQNLISEGKYRTRDAYESLYSGKENFKYLADCSHYFHHPKTAALIHRYNPDAKILISLRDPTERIYSEYMLHVRRGDLVESFSDFVEQMLVKDGEGKVSINVGSKLSKGVYPALLTPWLEYFGKDQIKIVLFDALKNDPGKICKEIYQWLEIDGTFAPELVQTQRGGVPSSRTLMHLLAATRLLPSSIKRKLSAPLRWKIRDFIYSRILTKERMPEDVRVALKDIYLPSVCELEEILSWNLAQWK